MIAALRGIMASNITNNNGDMVNDISISTPATAAPANKFSPSAVIDTALTLGDRLEDVKAIAMHSNIYAQALQEDLIQFLPGSDGSLTLKTFRGLAVGVPDLLCQVKS